VPALPPYLIEPILWQQFAALLPEREVNHPLGCHRPRIPDRVIFEKLIPRFWCSAAPTTGSLMSPARLLHFGTGATSGSKWG
jgi:hypothetical protein